MRRPPVHEWAVLGESSDPIPGDPDLVAELGQALRDTADAIQREAGEIKALASVETWQSKAADAFRDAAGGAVSSLQKAFHRYDVGARSMGTFVQEGSTANWASALETAQQMAAKALRDAQAADEEQRSVQGQLKQLPPNTQPTDPAAKGLNKRQEAASTALSKAKAELQAAKDARDRAAKAAADAIHRAITHDGLHDSTWDKVGSAVDTALSDTGHFLEDMGETALSDLASLGNAMVHDLGSVAAVAGGLGLATLGAGGEIGGFVLDATGIGAVLGVPAAVVSAAGITTGLGIAGAAMSNIMHDAAGPDRVNMSSNGGGGGVSDGTEPDPNLDRLRPAEKETLDRAKQQYPERGLKAASEERDGEYVDSEGRTYDQMGNPQTSRFWNDRSAQKFYRSIDAHLRKSTDFTLIDLTGFSEQSRADISAYVDSLPPDQQAKIVRIGF